MRVDGGFLQGFDVRFPVHPGRCTVDVRLEMGPIARTRQYALDAAAGEALEVRLEYSRMWGNFTASPRIDRVRIG